MNHDALSILLANLTAIIQSKKISENELSQLSGVPQSTVNRLFNSLKNGQSPRLDTIERIASSLGISLSSLFSRGISNVDLRENTKAGPKDLPHTVARQVARLTEEFLLSNAEARKEILRKAEECAAKSNL